jgi:hypothetical protein
VRRLTFVYKTTNKANGRYYIGVHTTDNIDDGYLGSGKLLNQAIEKYGRDNFVREIVEYYDTVEQAYLAEAEMVDVNDPLSYNLKNGGHGGWDHIKGDNWSVEARKSRSEKMKEHHQNGVFEKLTTKGYKHTPEAREKISIAAKNRKTHASGFKGKTHSEEMKRLISERTKLALAKRKARACH